MADLFTQEYYQEVFNEFMGFTRAELAQGGLSLTDIVPVISEICLRTTMEEEYLLHKKSLEQISGICITAVINGREIVVYGLLEKLTNENANTRTIELAGPHSKYSISGIQHIKLLTKTTSIESIFGKSRDNLAVIGNWNGAETLEMSDGKQIRLTSENLILKSLSEPGTVVKLLNQSS